MIIPFFFQAEDGIRDLYVTGVQTCALPICCAGAQWRRRGAACRPGRWSARPPSPAPPPGSAHGRSEERRVGKECRSRGFDNLTLTDDRLEAFYDNPTALHDYIRVIVLMFLA